MTMISDPGMRPRERPPSSARTLLSPLPDSLARHLQGAEESLRTEFKGITTDGIVAPGLFVIQKTGLSTRPLADAANALVASLSSREKASAVFPIDSDAWRRWSNVHHYVVRHGVCLEEMAPTQLDRALALLRESLSESGFETARNIMKLNESILEITGRAEDYGEWLYWVSVMGTPAPDEPWGWQIDGHHLIVNCFVLGDQLVTTPMFMGSEPVAVDAGKYAGTRVFEAEENDGLALIRALTPDQRNKAVLSPELPVELFTGAFRDNHELRYEGIRCDELSIGQRDLLVRLIQTYVGRIRPGHADARMEEVKRHLSETHFAWMGGSGDGDVFYYRVHSPVILIEFDHQRGIALDNDEPSRNHIHTVVRTPNGNDYGKDLLRQHYEQAHHSCPVSAGH